ncbi:hypothetical protein [Pseudanabaena sp. PCC 6802]|uniref:hypothetical protein n=1 Tax=Pseudanabaena sp. PCC 6802 TaxID=118173 RepID=UPI00034DDD60|nr:hypothetical protein [Pseudanabaena sp. PCC 6802]
MPSFKLFIIGSGIVGLLALGACSSGNQTSSSTPTSVETTAPTTTATKPTEAATSSSPDPAKTESQEQGKPKQGGQVVESGAYHLELVTGKEESGVHLDFFLQKGDNHEAIADAKVKAQVKLPDGTQKSLDLEYDASGKHYTILLPTKVPGEYQVAILSDIKGERVNGRFSFKL